MASIYKEYKTPLDSFIGAWFIDEDICDKLIDYFENNKAKATKGTTGTDRLDPEIKESLDLALSKNNKLLIEYWSKHFQKLIHLYEDRYKCVSKLSKYSLVEEPNIQYYNPGAGFKIWHCEREGRNTSNRQLVFMTFLNTAKGAGTEFYYQGLSIPCKKGLTLIWPTDFTHLHKGIINKKKQKYILTGWLNYI
tara:strand:+ start:67 stop:645 length:579 start_codon:yes stop_codon:yes gene_type:complete